MNVFLYTTLFLSLAGIILILVNIVRLLNDQRVKVSRFHYSDINYHIALIPMVAPLIIFWIYERNISALLLFLIFGLGGMLGETLFSVYWTRFFSKKFWEYKVDTIFNDYSSLLNFLPWSFGGFLYLALAQWVNFEPTTADLLQFWVTFVALLALVGISRMIKNTSIFHLRFKAFNLKNYAIIMLPYVGAVIISSVLSKDASIILASLLFGIIAFIAEYLFGKYCEKFVSKKLWVYNYMAHDKGHITVLSIIPFVLGGFWFMTIQLLVSLL